jgi:integrase
LNRGSIIPPKGKRKSWSAIVYTGKDDNGKKLHKRVSAPTKAEVEKKVLDIIYQVKNGNYAAIKGTVGEFIERWLKEYATPKLSPRTTEEYWSIYRSGIKPVFGKVLLSNLKPQAIQKYYADKLASGLTSTTVTHHHCMLHRALEHAVKWQILPRNPADAASPPGIRHTEMHTLDSEQVALFLETAKETPFFVEFHLALFTGMRRSELMALRWQDVDLIMAEISISRSMHQMNKPRRIIFRGTKTVKSARKIALEPDTCEVLRKHLDNEMSLCARLNVTFTNDRLLFCEWDGTPLAPDRVSRAWDRLMKKLEYPHVRFHDARHTHASLLLKADIHPKIVQERLGHANIETTLNIYSHVAPNMQHRAAEAFGKMIRATTRATTGRNQNTEKVSSSEI